MESGQHSEQLLRILIIGGYGTFGGRVCELLIDEPRVHLLVAGRSIEKAQAFCGSLSTQASLQAVHFDRDEDVHEQLSRYDADIVVDASGPFQLFTEDPYRVVRACLALRIDYLDLSDGSAFVRGVRQFDEQARQNAVCLLSGVSSFPALTGAVVRHIAQDLCNIERITAGVTPSPFAGVGRNVIRAIAGYAGEPIEIVRHGETTMAFPWTEGMRYTIAPPGQLPLRSVYFSLVDVPDLTALPEVWPDVKSVWVGAGPVPEIWHRCLNILAWLRRYSLIPNLQRFADVFHAVINRWRWGSHRGGMFVEVQGQDQVQTTVIKSWHMIANGDDGPLIPSMAIAAIIRRRLNNNRCLPGARSAINELSLCDYEQLFSNHDIEFGLRSCSDHESHIPLYQQILGDAWHNLPEEIRRMHDSKRSRSSARGLASVERGSNQIANLVAKTFRFPKSGSNIEIVVEFERKSEGELWRRTFANRSFQSRQHRGRGRTEHLLIESFGPFSFDLALLVEQAQLKLLVRGWRFLGLRLPNCLAPYSNAHEHASNGRFNFHVEIGHRWVGRIVRYRGWLQLDDANFVRH